MFKNKDIEPILMDDKFIPYMRQCDDDFSRKNRGINFSSDDIKNWFCSFFSKKPCPERIVFDLDKYRLDIIRQISTRDREAVLYQWAECGIDRVTAEYYMAHFALKDNEGKKIDLIIPSDPATVFVWYYYEVYCWEEIGAHFGIYIYIWLYGFFFPHFMFEIPSRDEISDEEYKYLYDNYDKFEYEMTMRRTVELILLYKDEINMNSSLFEPDIPICPIHCNLEWRKKLEIQRSEPS
jgi:hypothetical protein